MPYFHPMHTSDNPQPLHIFKMHSHACTRFPHSNPLTPSLPPQKSHRNKLSKKHFTKKCKNRSCRDALPPKNTSLKTNETSCNEHRNVFTQWLPSLHLSNHKTVLFIPHSHAQQLHAHCFRHHPHHHPRHHQTPHLFTIQQSP